MHELEDREVAVRDQLMGTLTALDRKRHDAMDLRRQLSRRGPIIALIGGAAAAAIAVAVVLERRASPGRKRRQRVKALERMWRHPEQVGRGERVSIWRDFGRKLSLAVLSALVITPIESGLKRLVKRQG